MNLPKVRTSDIIEQEAGSELMIYDLRNDKAYNLNETSKIVYKACRKQTFAELKRQFKLTDDLIYFALDQLKNQNLLADESYASPFEGLNRREVIKKIGLTSMTVLPVISGIIAPGAAQAASNCLAPTQQTSGSFTGIFGAALNSSTCINDLRARCCSGSGSGGCGCNPGTVGAPTLCTGTYTCA